MEDSFEQDKTEKEIKGKNKQIRVLSYNWVSGMYIKIKIECIFLAIMSLRFK
jgi:hypothetical protein